MSEPRTTLLDKMLGVGAAAGLRGKANETKKKLDAAGLEHKAAKSKDEAKTKALMEAIRAKIEAAIGQVTEGAPPELVDAVMQVIMTNAMETPAPTEEPAPEAPMEEMAEDEIPVEEEEPEEEELALDEEDEEDKGLTIKATSLFDSLIESQAQLTLDQSAMTKAIEELKPLVELVDQVKELKATVSKLERQLSNRPRMASRASETEIEVEDLSPEIKEHLVQKNNFWGANLAPEGMK